MEMTARGPLDVSACECVEKSCFEEPMYVQKCKSRIEAGNCSLFSDASSKRGLAKGRGAREERRQTKLSYAHRPLACSLLSQFRRKVWHAGYEAKAEHSQQASRVCFVCFVSFVCAEPLFCSERSATLTLRSQILTV